MRKSEALNTFTQGLVMDINPLVAPNDGLCNALNATIITMNGNENVLQNDMGNGRVETAFLPEGYVPLGTTELGGVIYIVSYNPLDKKCQIGSFPSPERNISSDEITDLKQILTNQDFKYQDQTGALVYYLKKDLNEKLIFNPGDKFIVYGDTIDSNYDNLYKQEMYTPSQMNIAKEYTIKLDIGTITDNGKLVKFENLKQYKIVNKGTYHIFQYEDDAQGQQKPDLDEYRSLVSQPYNIFSSKISGSLVLIAELVQFNDFDVQLHHKFDTSGEHKSYIPKVTFNFSGEYPFIPKGVICETTLVQGDTEIAKHQFDYIVSDSDIRAQIGIDNTSYEVQLESLLQGSIASSIQQIANSGYFDKGERSENYIIRYKFTPCMNWGAISYLAVSGQIDLDRLGTGYIQISQWRYYNESNKCNLTWGLEIYEEEGHSVDNVEMELIRFTSPESTESVTYSINKKASYFGIFYDVLPTNEDYYRLSGQLKPNNLYLVKIKVTYVDSSTKESEVREFYRWIYTNTVFNQYYTDTNDFQELSLDFNPNFRVDYDAKSIDESSSVYGIIQKSLEGLSEEQESEAKNTKTSLSAIQTSKDFTVSGELVVGLAQDYNTFYIEAIQNAFNITPNEDSFECISESTIKYTDIEDPNQEEYLSSSGEIISGDLDNYKIPEDKSEQDVSDTLLSIPTNVVKYESFKIESFKDNIYSILVKYKALQMVKAYCVKIASSLVYKGRFLPLAYNRETFRNYNLEWDTTYSKWLPDRFGLFGFEEQGGDDGKAWIGGWVQGVGSAEKTEVEKANNLWFRWTQDADIPAAQQIHGWNNTAIFFIHAWSGDDSDGLSYWNGGRYSWPTDRHSDTNRVQLAFRSNNDNYFYPIDCSQSGNGSSNNELMRTKTPFSNLYHDFAQYLNNIYRYDSEQAEQSCVIPQFIYYMDQCVYAFIMQLDIISNDNLQNCKIQLVLDNGRIDLNSMINSMIDKGHLKNEKYPTLENNIVSTIHPVDDSFRFNITNQDNRSGIELRNNMLNKMNTNLGSAIMGYNGTDILGDITIVADNKSLYMRKDTTSGSGTKYGIVKATKFSAKSMKYTTQQGGADYEVIPEAQTSSLAVVSNNLNKYFTIDDDGLLVLKDPKSSEYSFKRDGEKDTGTADGYQKLVLFNKYKAYK